ncbi:MAG: hypothetical protein GWN84_01320 [Gammaproteobacteria bacterium]|nr:hypothetical protein [Gammaproteobacteria bacterium]NIR81802.1 hypothetical protein [Gammaproteobacteria bacterium]NIR88634.1 hypothetical protein [Gammaproteobacteria bacterium]NIU02910.1 hypothetical protein [Gammaproteobacteria bacterium]NIV50431.1 hypothetical protein [Gammaproteobacteria bacterium]
MSRWLRILARSVTRPFVRLYHHAREGVPGGQRVSLWLLFLEVVIIAAAVAAVVWNHLNVLEAVAVVLGFSFLTDLMVARSMERSRHLDAKSGVEAMLGRPALVEGDFEVVTPHARGRVRFNGESWAARADADKPPRAGETVTIVAVEGLTLHVTRESGSADRSQGA